MIARWVSVAFSIQQEGDVATMRYELWQDKGGYTFFPENNNTARNLLLADAELIWTVEADSFEEAQTKKHEYLGWEPYQPMD